jgi:acyl-CoA reductase-like NAD-dependent aldehyde dehydrogenase
MVTSDTEEQAVEMANNTSYGLAGYVQAGTIDDARRIGAKIRAGRIYLNALQPTTRCHSAGTSSPATAVSMACSASRSILR